MEVENGMLYGMMDIDMDMIDRFKRTPACWGRSNLCCEPRLGLCVVWPCGRRRAGWRPLHSPGCEGTGFSIAHSKGWPRMAVPLTWFRSQGRRLGISAAMLGDEAVEEPRL